MGWWSKLSKQEIDDFVRKAEGRKAEPATPKSAATCTLVEAGVVYENNRLVITVPCVLRSEANESQWQRTMARKLTVKKMIRQVLGPSLRELLPFADAFHNGYRSLKVTITKLGGRQFDKDNLYRAVKVVQDMIAGALLVDDGSPSWMMSAEQEPGGPCGVRIEIEVFQ